MSAKIIDGVSIAAKVNMETGREVARLAREYNIQPGLAVVLVGDDPASKVYVNTKTKRCAELGIYSEKIVLDKNTSQADLINLVKELNRKKNVHGILVQSPPPRHIDERAVTAAIDPEKDVDCFHPENVGKVLLGWHDGFLPCTPAGVMALLEESGVDPAGKHAVVLGRSNIVGKPMAALLMQKGKGADATVTICHSRSKNTDDICRSADILIAAVGKAGFVRGDMVKEGAVVIDVGMNRVPDPSSPKGSRLAGDVDFAGASERASLITPVPGGVGQMTVAMLMRNTLKACKKQNSAIFST
jgi:methylenetetrahydrofolate dehydrogenase (NADP+)/methenyltetrahydrofolate cyclohydrolase